MSYLQRMARYTGIYWAASTLLVLLVMILVGWLVNRNLEADRELPLIQALDSYVAAIESTTSNSRAVGAEMLFGLVNQETKRVALGELPPDAPAVLAALNDLRGLKFFDEVFLVNARGIIVAYSTNEAKRGTGKDISYRPYVQLALQGKTNVYPALGSTSMLRGIYIAAPLRITTNVMSAPIGVIVVKVGADNLDRLLKTWTDGIAVLVSPQGVVFAGSRDDWRFRLTGEVNADRIAEIKQTKQFGKLFDQPQPSPLSFSLDTPEAQIDGVRYVVRSRPLAWDDPKGIWRLGLLDRREPWWEIWSVMGFAGLAGLIAAAALYWLYTLVNMRRKDAHTL